MCLLKLKKKKLNHVLSVYGTVRILKYLGKNAIVRNQEIESLKRLLNSNYNIQLFDGFKLNQGDEVEVINGSLTGLKAVVVKEKKQT